MGGTTRTSGRLGGVLSGLAVAVGCVLFLGGFAWGAALYRPYTVPTDSMTPTVAAGDRVLARRIDGSEVRRGDVVVFTDRAWGGLPTVKRVVGIGGDTVACCDADGLLTVDGEPVREPYLRSHGRGANGTASPTEFAVTVPEGRLFLLGDHRAVSQDSRAHLQEEGRGSVPRSAVTGRLDAVVWPPGGLGEVDRPQGFAALPGGVSDPGPVRSLAWAVAAGAALILGGAAYGPLARLGSRPRAHG
ncbi:signal peptidase I [Streptomyces sudanensis]|uniref:signal peptidase I n=1 Tax=Streptomyces sudanensis TaxID=436397 RepID=UPI0020CD9E1E|nr:signal peptidase I [Streptomyces sudanensis]MCP9957098.1 signal peptidase I [Streptomyces sudanensis]MCQ0002322.1 signal peptidase I [Streptomyces sudanensis]